MTPDQRADMWKTSFRQLRAVYEDLLDRQTGPSANIVREMIKYRLDLIEARNERR